MSKPYSREFRDDVVGVARNRGDGVRLGQVAEGLGVRVLMLNEWLWQYRIDTGGRVGVTAFELVVLRGPAGGSACWSGRIEVLCRVLKVASQLYSLLPLVGLSGDRCRVGQGASGQCPVRCPP